MSRVLFIAKMTKPGRSGATNSLPTDKPEDRRHPRSPRVVSAREVAATAGKGGSRK